MQPLRAALAVALVAGAPASALAEPVAEAVRPAGDASSTVELSTPPPRREAPRDPHYTVARVTNGSVELHARPGARVVGRAGPQTEFGSPTALAVAARRGR